MDNTLGGAAVPREIVEELGRGSGLDLDPPIAREPLPESLDGGDRVVRDPVAPLTLLMFALICAGGLFLIWSLYREMFLGWWGSWIEPGSFYAHAVFVPFFVAVMIHRNWDRIMAARWNPAWSGLALFVPSMTLLTLAMPQNVIVLKSLSFILLLLGTSLLWFGKGRTRALLFPLLFIVTMIPLFPDQLINVIAFPIQLKSTQIATFMLNLMTLHANREGTMIQMDTYRMAVEGACSGFKTLLSLLTFSAAFAYLVEGAVWKRWTLFLVTAPLSLLINGLRITLIGVVGELISTKAAATFHDYSGFIVLILAFAFLFNFARVLRCDRFLGVPLDDSDRRAPDASAPPEPAKPSLPDALKRWRPTNGSLRRSAPFLACVDGVLLATLLAQGHFARKPTPQDPIGTADVPMALASNGVKWNAVASSRNDHLDKSVLEQLNPMRVIARHYSGSDGGNIEVFMTAGNSRWTFHDPHNCSLGSDAQLEDQGIVTIPTSRGDLRVLESRYKRLGSPEIREMMFCYVAKGQVLQRTEEMHQSLWKQTLFGDDGKPSYFLRFTQDSPGTEDEKRQQLIRFIGAMWGDIAPVVMGQKPAHKEPPPTPVSD